MGTEGKGALEEPCCRMPALPAAAHLLQVALAYFWDSASSIVGRVGARQLHFKDTFVTVL